MKAVFVFCGCGAVANAAALAAKQQSFTLKVSALNVLATLTSTFIFHHHVCLRVHGSLFGLSGCRLLVLFGFACLCVCVCVSACTTIKAWESLMGFSLLTSEKARWCCIYEASMRFSVTDALPYWSYKQTPEKATSYNSSLA